MEAAQGVFVIGYILHFVNKKVIVAPFGQIVHGIFIQIIGRGNVPECVKFLIDICDTGCASMSLKPNLQLLEYITLAYGGVDRQG